MFSLFSKRIFSQRKGVRHLAKATVYAGICAFIFVLYADRTVGKCSGRVIQTLDNVPENRTALVLGTGSKLKNGHDNPYFTFRIKAAAELFHAGKVSKLILSGDNSSPGYNEPADMRNALLALGVCDSALILDYAGFRTLDSVTRAKNVFGADSLLVVSQPFHCERAIYLALGQGIDAQGYAAEEVKRRSFLVRTAIREPLARAVAWLDVNILKTKPRFEL